MVNILQDERSSRLYGDKPIIIPKDRYQEIIAFYQKSYTLSKNWFDRNYRDDFVRYEANYQSIPGETIKPWDEANDYFMPSTNIIIETYLARFMETIRGARDFVTVLPRGREDEFKAKMAELHMRWQFENPMDGYKNIVDIFRSKLKYGTAICQMPWNLEIAKKKIHGIYIFDSETDAFVTEAEDHETPKDFSGVDLDKIMSENPTFKLKDLYEDVIINDNPDLELIDPFNVKVDPNGGPDIQKHDFVIVESFETIDEIRRKARQGVYSKSQVDKLIQQVTTPTDREDEDKTSAAPYGDQDGKRKRDLVEDKMVHSSVRNAVRIWTCYGRHEVGFEDFEEETIAIIANKDTLLRFRDTPYKHNGKSFRPLLVDRFVTLPHRFYGIGQAEILEALNFLLNHLVNQILNHGDLHNSPPLITPAEGMWDPSQVVYGPGQTWSSDQGDAFRILPTPDIKASQVQMIQFIEGFIQKSLGILDFTLSSGGSGVANDTAHGLANVLRETNRRIDFYSQTSHETFIKDMYEMMHKESVLFMDRVEIAKTTDDPEAGFIFDDVAAEDIDGFFDIKIFGDSLTASKEFERVKWGQLTAQYAELKDPATLQPLYDVRKLGDKQLEAWGEPFPSMFHAQPQEQAPAAPPQEGEGQGGPQNPAAPSLPGVQADEGTLGAI